MSGGKVDDQFVIFFVSVIMGELKKDGGNFVLGVAVHYVSLVGKVTEERAKKELHDVVTEISV